MDEHACPDGGDHNADQCHRFGCSNYMQELEAHAPWGTSRQGLKAWSE